MNDSLGMDRRSLLQRALVLAGAGAMASSCKKISGAKGDARLDTGQFALLTAISDTIIPKAGTVSASDVGVPKLFEGLLGNWASPETRTDLLGALDAIDKRAGGSGFAALPEEKRHEILKAYDLAALAKVEAKEAPSGMAAMMAGPPVADPVYAKLKELIVTLYYYSEGALTKELQYEHIPGSWDPSVPVTAETRQTGGFGFL